MAFLALPIAADADEGEGGDGGDASLFSEPPVPLVRASSDLGSNSSSVSVFARTSSSSRSGSSIVDEKCSSFPNGGGSTTILDVCREAELELATTATTTATGLLSLGHLDGQVPPIPRLRRAISAPSAMPSPTTATTAEASATIGTTGRSTPKDDTEEDFRHSSPLSLLGDVDIGDYEPNKMEQEWLDEQLEKPDPMEQEWLDEQIDQERSARQQEFDEFWSWQLQQSESEQMDRQMEQEYRRQTSSSTIQ
jgi:hypothetical protein